MERISAFMDGEAGHAETHHARQAVAMMFESRGFSSVRCYPVLGGLMTIHHATRA